MRARLFIRDARVGMDFSLAGGVVFLQRREHLRHRADVEAIGVDASAHGAAGDFEVAQIRIEVGELEVRLRDFDAALGTSPVGAELQPGGCGLIEGVGPGDASGGEVALEMEVERGQSAGGVGVEGNGIGNRQRVGNGFADGADGAQAGEVERAHLGLEREGSILGIEGAVMKERAHGAGNLDVLLVGEHRELQ